MSKVFGLILWHILTRWIYQEKLLGNVAAMSHFPLTLVLVSFLKFLPFQEVALDDTLLAWPGTFEQWMRGLELSSIDQLLNLFKYSPDTQHVLGLSEYLSYFLHTKLCSHPFSMCCRLLCVHPFSRPYVIMGIKASIFIHNSLVEFQTQTCFNHPPVTTVSHYSLPAIIHLHPQKWVSLFLPLCHPYFCIILNTEQGVLTCPLWPL